MIKLDIKDRKLVYYLSEDCRMSNTQLSKKIGLSKNAIQYRIERLKKEGILTQFACVVNLGKLNLTTADLLLKFNTDIYEQKEIIEYFRNYRFANWVTTLSGKWDILVEIVVKDIFHLQDCLTEIVGRFSKMLNRYELYIAGEILRVEHLIEDFYKDLKLQKQAIKPRIRGNYSLDKTDKNILYLLNQDASLAYLSIAQKLNMTIDVVRYRIKNMVKNGIILKFFSEFSMRKLGYTKYLYKLKLRNISKERADSLVNRIRHDTRISYSFFDITGFTVFLVCVFKDASEIDHLSRGLRRDYLDIIEEEDYLLIKEEILFNLFPKGLIG
jgi:DNA-binding Lrp family transcriptional regulator